MTRDDPSLKSETPEFDDGAASDAERFDLVVEADHAGIRLDKWLSGQLELTRSRLKGLIDGGALTRNGKIFTDGSSKLREGEKITLIVPPAENPAPKGENIPLDIVYEDADLIVINKPASLVVHPGAGNWTGTLVNALIHHCGDTLSGIGGVARPGIVHRLDKDTSGLIVAAKHDRAHQGLSEDFSVHDIERVYEAVACGSPRPGIGTIDEALARANNDRKKMTVVDEYIQNNEGEWVLRPGARRAVTHYKVIENFGRSRAKLKGDALACHIECRLETGRTHQIRAHLAHIGHPLVGDPVYGRGPGLAGLKPGERATDKTIEILKNFRRQALHARVLGFTHPVTGEALRFERPAPGDFQTLLSALRDL